MNKIEVAVVSLTLLIGSIIVGCRTWGYTSEEQMIFDAGVATAFDWYNLSTPMPHAQDVADMKNAVVPKCWSSFKPVTNGVYSPLVPEIMEAVNLKVSRPEVCKSGITKIISEMDKLFAANPLWKADAETKYAIYLTGVRNGLYLNIARKNIPPQESK